MKDYSQYEIATGEAGRTVEAYLKEILHCSGRKIQKLTRLRGILLNGKPAFLQKKIKTGDRLQVLLLPDQSYGVTPEEGKIDILYEDEQLIILNKPAGQLVHPTERTKTGTLANYLAFYFQQKGQMLTIRPLHRLDRDTSGCVIFAKSVPIQTELEKQLESGAMKRQYWALVQGGPESEGGVIDAPIGVNPDKPNQRMVTAPGEQAITRYRVLERLERFSLLELELETGRTHQIRVHLAYLGCPVLGDRMYGNRSALIGRQALHAVSLALLHPQTGMPLKVEAPLPGDMKELLKRRATMADKNLTI